MDKTIILLGLMLFYGFSVEGQENDNKVGGRNVSESEYYYAFTEATKMMIYQNYPQAISLYMKCLEYNPNSSSIRYQLSLIAYKIGNIEEAKKYGIEAYKMEKKNRWFILHLIKIYQTVSELDSAIILARKLVQIEPERIENQLNLAILYQINKEYKASLNLLNAIELNYGKSKETCINKYRIYQQLNKDKKALNQLMEASVIDKEDYNIIGLIAEYYRDKGEKDSADLYYKRLLKENKLEPVAVFSYIDYLIQFKEYQEAIKYFVTCIKNEVIRNEHIIRYIINELENKEKLKEHNCFFDSVMNYLYAENKEDIRIEGLMVDYNLTKENFSIAAEHLKRMLLKNEMSYRIWEQILFAENALRRYDSVIYYGEEAIKNFEYQAIPYLYTGIAYEQKENYLQAVKVLEKGYKLSDNKRIIVQFYIFLAEAYNQLMKKNISFEYYQKALEIEQDNLIIMNNYAYFLALESKELEKAEELSHYTIERERRNYTYLDTYAWIMYKQNKISKAKRFIKRAIRYGGNNNREIIEHYNIIFSK